MANVAYEKALEVVRALSPEQLQKLLHQIEAERQHPAAPVNGVSTSTAHRELEMRWLSEHEADYAGQWLALDGDRLLSHGNDFKEVVAEARSQGVENPFLAFAESNEPAMGGWL